MERPRPKGSKSEPFVRSMSMRADDCNQTAIGAFKRQSSLRPGDLSTIQEMKFKDPYINTSNSHIFLINFHFKFI